MCYESVSITRCEGLYSEVEAALGPVHPGRLASQPGSTPFPGQTVLIHLKEGKDDAEFRAFSLKSPFSSTSLSYFSALSALAALGAGRAGTVPWVESTSSAGKNLVKGCPAVCHLGSSAAVSAAR